MEKKRSRVLGIVVISIALSSGIAYAVDITAPDVPRFGDVGSDNLITGAVGVGERATWQIIMNFTADGQAIGDRLFLLNGTGAAAANFTTPIFQEILTQTDIVNGVFDAFSRQEGR